MFELLKTLYWQLSKKSGRYDFFCFFFRNIPGEFGDLLRGKFYRRYLKKVGKNFRVQPGTVIVHPENITIKDNVIIGYNNFIQAGGGLTIGSNFLSGPYAKIWTQNHRFDSIYDNILEQGYEYRPIVIGDDVWIGAATFIMPGVVLADKMVIAANSVVGAKVYKSGMILSGNPARVIKIRD